MTSATSALPSNKLPIRQVIDAEGAADAIAKGEAWTDGGVLIHSGDLDGTDSTAAKAEITRVVRPPAGRPRRSPIDCGTG